MGAGRTAALVGGITLLGAALRAIALNGGLWLDEIVTLTMSVRLPVSRLVVDFPGNNNHPLYSLLAHASVAILGETPWTLRLPAFLFGVAAIPALFWLARMIAPAREAASAALLLAVSYHHVWFSQNARGYTILALCTILSTGLLWRGLHERTAGWFAGYALVTALGAYTHLTMIFVTVGQAIACLAAVGGNASPSVRRIDWRLLGIGMGLAAIGTVVLYGPMLAQLYRYYTAAPPATAEVATVRWAVLEGLRGLRVGFGTLAVPVLAILFLTGLGSYLAQDRLLTGLFVSPVIVTAVVAIAAEWPIRPRFFFFVIGFGVLAIVRGIELLSQQLRARVTMLRIGSAGALPRVLVASFVVASGVSLIELYRYPKQDFGGALVFLDERQGSGDPVLTAGPAVYPYREFYRRPWPSLHSAQEFRNVLTRGRPAWLVYTFPEYIQIETPDLMAEIQTVCEPVKRFQGTVGGGDVIICRADPLK